MKVKDVVLGLVIILGLGGCHMGPYTYEVFANNMELNMRNWTPTEYMIKNHRKIYDENRYIYKFKGDDPRCIYGYLTNKDDKPEKVIGWIILSGKENCKQQQAYSLF